MAELAVSLPSAELPSGLAALVERFAPHDHPVVITGPIGVGKPYLARVIHERSRRGGVADWEGVGAVREGLHSRLEATEWDVVQVAARLGVSRATLYRRIQALGLSRPRRIPQTGLSQVRLATS